MTTHSDSGDEDALSRLLSQRRVYEAEREELSARIREVNKNIAAIQAEYGAIYNKSSKLLRLPPEVTCMIFDHASGYPMEEVGDEEFKAVHLLPEVVISHVCRRWREISLSYPRLWTSFSYDGPIAIRIPLQRFAAYLKRSGTLDLELWIEFGYHPQELEDDSSAKHLKLLEMAIEQAHRWKRVTLILNSGSSLLDTIMPKLQKISVPKLEHLALCAEEEEDLKEPSYLRTSMCVNKVETTIFQGGANNLKSLRVDGKTYVACTPPLSNLTALRIESITANPDSILSWTAFLSILELPSLQDLSLVGDIFETPTIETIKIIDMNNLKSLRYSDNDTISLILPFIRAPLLESLTLQAVWLPEELGSIPMQSSEPYFFPSLHSLDLIDVTPSTPQGAWYLVRMTRRAKDILISQEDAEGCIMMFIPAAYRSHPSFWPDIERLTVNMDATEEVGTFIQFFNCRPATKKDHKYVLRIFEHIKANWLSQFEPLYNELCNKCDIETVKLEDLAVGFWPPAEQPPDYFCDDADPFDIPNAY